MRPDIVGGGRPGHWAFLSPPPMVRDAQGWAWRLGRHGLAEGLTTRKGQPLAKEAKLLAMNVCRIRDGWKRCGSFIPGTSVLIGGASIVAKSHWKE